MLGLSFKSARRLFHFTHCQQPLLLHPTGVEVNQLEEVAVATQGGLLCWDEGAGLVMEETGLMAKCN